MNYYKRQEQRAMEQVELWLYAVGFCVLIGIVFAIVVKL